MSSAGTPRRTFRFADQFWDEVEATVARRNFWTREEPWTLSDFVRIAIVEKLAKMERCRRPGRRRRPAAGQALADQVAAEDRTNGQNG